VTAAVTGSVGNRRPGRPYLAPVPDSEPPYDPEGTADAPATAARTRRSPRRTAAAFVRALPTDGPATVTDAPTSPTCRAVPSWSSGAEVGVRRTTTGQLAPASRAAQVLATALVEVLAGRRPVGQLRVHCAPPVYAGLSGRAPKSGAGDPLTVLSVRVGQPADGVAEACATVRHGQRVRALAFRMEGVDGRWRVTALEIG
jgi:hypothetical protein